VKVKCISGLYDPKTSGVYTQNGIYEIPADFMARFPGYFEAEGKMQKAPENKMVTAAKETTKAEVKEEAKTEKKKTGKKNG